MDSLICEAYLLKGALFTEDYNDLHNGLSMYQKALDLASEEEIPECRFFVAKGLYFLAREEECYRTITKWRKKENLTAFDYGLELMAIILTFLENPQKLSQVLSEHYTKLDDWLTMVRNEIGSTEEAFASVIARVDGTLDLEHIDNMKCIHVIGESHIIPICWRKVHLQGQTFVLKPNLVMGLKAFYFDAKFNSREKQILKEHQKKVPKNSLVIICCGEVDCRPHTGMLSAIERGKYPDIESAAESTSISFVNGALQWKKDASITIAIHPIRPPSFRSSEEEKNRIQCLNRSIKKKVEDLNDTSIFVLDLKGLEDQNGFLKEEYNSGDEVHLNHLYVSLLEKELQRNMERL
eukprot:TRINITY_DN10927_c0_g1_i2.p1 TRINITY_DN10927_c0_g1~~TRINITY_DN10927_c0_g1_i2.p1  ORF type:complete len:351 (-),score=80.05 TRINITY_DN10927_c0_g1_i2:70-1122(-)